MRRPRGIALVAILGVAFARLASAEPQAPGSASDPAPTPSTSATSATSTPASTATPRAGAPTLAPKDLTRGEGMRAYHAAMTARRLGTQRAPSAEEFRERVAEAEIMARTGRTDEAISRLTEIVESNDFAQSAETEEGRAAVLALGEAYATAGINQNARGYLRRVLATKGAWESRGPYARRAVKKIVEIGLETKAFQDAEDDLKEVPESAPEETKAEMAYLRGRAKEAAGDPEAALGFYAKVPETSRFWSQATYLSGLIHVERGRAKEGENLFCKVADPKRQDRTTPVFADEKFFAVRDLARLALGRVAHDQFRHDDARYYYYLVPRDSDRLSEALYEAATTRYEKKDYQGARELLDELKKLDKHHRYEDEAGVLDAYIDLALCRFPESDRKLRAFIAKYEPVRDAARTLGKSDRGVSALLAAAQNKGDAGSVEATSLAVSPDSLRTVAALVRIDPAYAQIAKKAVILDREVSGLRLARRTLADMQASLATNGGVRPATLDKPDLAERDLEARSSLDGVRRDLDDLAAAKGQNDPAVLDLKKELTSLQAKLVVVKERAAASDPGESPTDLGGLWKRDEQRATELSREVDTARTELRGAEQTLAKDALNRLDLRLSRLLRRARLGRIESVLGKKRALEVEIEAIADGFLPRDAVDSLDASRYLKDSEEYWPFEGDDWPDEYVGGEGLR